MIELELIVLISKIYNTKAEFQTVEAKKYIIPLVEAGLLRMTHPDNPGSPQQRFITK